MTGGAGRAPLEIVGRERELAVLERFTDTAAPVGALLLTGEPGIGKTTLWEAGVERARDRGWRVLVTRPSRASARLSYSALADLLDGVDLGRIGLPVPQARVLGVAVLRAAAADADAPDPHAVTVSFCNALRGLARERPLVLAIDDLQWLDRPSATAVAYGARRLDAAGFLLAKRHGAVTEPERVLRRSVLEGVDVPALTIDETRYLLWQRLGLALPRRVLVRVFEASRGNPLFALELGRAIAERGVPEIGADVPLPDDVEHLIGTRVGRLAAPLRRALLALALAGDLGAAELGAVAGEDAVDDGVDAGVLVREGDRVRAAHPLVAAAAARRARTRERRAMHLDLAATVDDEPRRALHLALATDRANEPLAARVAAASAAAHRRAAWHDAGALAEHALRLTPADSPRRLDRTLELAHLIGAGEASATRITQLLRPLADSLPPGRDRARVLLQLAEGEVDDADAERALYEQALAEGGDDPEVCSVALAELALNRAVVRVVALPDAARGADDAFAVAPHGSHGWVMALHALAWTRALAGSPVDDLAERYRREASSAPTALDPERIAVQRAVWRGELGEARAMLARLLVVAERRGEGWPYEWLRLHLCELELRAGDVAAAAHAADSVLQSADRTLVLDPACERCRALCASYRGDVRTARASACLAGDLAERAGVGWDELEAKRAFGLAALLAHDPAGAAAAFGEVWERTASAGVADPGAFPAGPDLAEAYAETGRLDEACAVADRLAEAGERLDHPWARIAALRARGVIAAATGDLDGVTALLEAAASDAAARGLRFDEARALLLLGRANRRARRWGVARSALDAAAEAFDGCSAPGWAAEARAELERVGARRPHADGGLTAAERRVVDLAIEGLANKEIAAALHVTVHTVEAHLSRVYAKLGVRSRTQLARRVHG